MTNLNNMTAWYKLMETKRLQEQGEELQGQDMPGLGAPTTDPYGGSDMPNIANQPAQEEPQPMGNEDDLTQDPQAPDMDDFGDSEADFEVWKKDFFELAIKGDTNEMLDAIGQVRDRNLSAPQRRFVEDNLQIVLLRQDANFDKASKEIRKLINQNLDRNNPSVSLMSHLNDTLEAYPVINNILIKLAGEGAIKGELHRRWVGGLTGAVQTGSGGNRQDFIFPARDYTIDISTRFYTTWGDISIGKWTLQEDDPEKILSDSELERLQEGSPEEKRVLRRRVCLESIASKFAQRAFIIYHVDPANGTISSLGWDVAETLRAGYKEGTLVVRKRKSKMRDAMIDDNGAIIPLFSYSILYKKQSSDMGSSNEEVPFIEQRDGSLYLTASPETLQELAGGLGGITFLQQAWQGNPSDINALMRCWPSTVEMLMRRC